MLTAHEYQLQDALGLAEWVASGEVQPIDLLETALAIAKTANPKIAAICIDMEREARETLEAGVPDGPFRGVPFLLKDLHLLYTGTRTTHGCRLFADHVADHDSELVGRYRRAGLVVFGKSASPEFGLTTATESALFGATRNPWNLGHTSGGSSGGASAAVAAGILPAANASDGGGSIRIPAACCGLFGLKPTRGRVPAGPDIGEGWSGMSTVHAVTRSVRDSAALLDASAGPDLGAPYWAERPARPFLDEVGAEVGSLHIGLQTDTFNGTPTHPDCLQAAEDAAGLCESLGHRVEPVRLDLDSSAIGRATNTIISGNLLNSLEQRAAILGRDLSEDDVEPMTWGMAQAARSLHAADYARAVQTIHATGRRLARFLVDLDVLLTPTMALPPPEIGKLSPSNPNLKEVVDHLLPTVGFTQLANVTGNPAMSLPLAWNDAGLPIGIQFTGRYADESGLLRLAGQLETARPWFERRAPALG